ncbi:MAG TPA: hypothetical protein VGG74_26940 [Kofleriaceae bacterium]|jgi:hypothetical protein
MPTSWLPKSLFFLALLSFSTQAAPRKAAKVAQTGKTQWDGAYESDTAHGTDAGPQTRLLCPGDGINNTKYIVFGGKLTFVARWVDGEDDVPKNGNRSIKITVPLHTLDAKTTKQRTESATAMAEFDEMVPIDPITITSDQPTKFDKAHVYGTFLNLAPKGTDQAVMGTGRSAEIIVNLGEKGEALAACGGSRINALEGFTGPDRSKGHFCNQDDADCTSDGDCCSHQCSSQHHEIGKCY